MATVELKSFKPKRGNKTSFWYSLGIEDEKTARTDAVHQGFKPKVYRNIIERTKLSQSEFHNVTHIPVSTIKRRLKNGERFSTQESDAIYRLAMLIKLATELFNDEKRACTKGLNQSGCAKVSMAWAEKGHWIWYRLL